MSTLPSSAPPDAHLPRTGRNARRSARLVAAALRAGRSSANDAFDRFLPDSLREVSDKYWTPLSVVRRVAAWLREEQIRTVVDIGSGAGKFCVAGALLTRCRFIGLEQRASLVDAARDLAAAFEVDDRVTFVHGNCDPKTTPVGEAYYFFNPFGPYRFDSPRFAEPTVTFTSETQRADLAAVTDLLTQAPVGTFAVTYNGFGAKLPPAYEQLDFALRIPGTLRLWKKTGN